MRLNQQASIIRSNRSLQRLAVDGTELEFEVHGSGEPVLLIHGGLLADAFAPLLAQSALTSRFRVISYHRRGFAGSARPEGGVSIARQAADARALLDDLGITTAHVVGHSYGGLIALQLALDSPKTVSSLALLEPALLAVPSGEQFVATVLAAGERYEAGDRAAAVDVVLRAIAGAAGLAALDHAVPGALDLAATDVDTFFQVEVPALQAWSFGVEEARRITQPVLAVQGADTDALAPLFGEGIALLRQWLPQAEFFMVPAATHGLPFMNPSVLAEGLVDFFARHSPRTADGDEARADLIGAVSRRDVVRGLAAGASAVALTALAAELEAAGASPTANPAATNAVKLVALYGPPADVKDFERYYAETHIPLAHRLPGLKRVETARLRSMGAGEAAPYHRIAELWFADMAQFQAAVVSPEGQALAADVANFATGGLTLFIAHVDAPAAKS